MARGNKKVWVYENLKQRIINIDLEPGAPIIEAAFADDLGVSKTPVREALRQLERDGLVVNIPSRGSAISHITSREIHDVFQTREIIEAGAAKRAASAESNPELAEYREENEKILKSIDETDARGPEWGKWEDIHQIIVRSLDNESLAGVFSSLLDRIQRIRNYYGKRLSRRRFRDIVLEHNAIADAILSRDGTAAERKMQSHLRNASRYLLGVNVPPGQQIN